MGNCPGLQHVVCRSLHICPGSRVLGFHLGHGVVTPDRIRTASLTHTSLCPSYVASYEELASAEWCMSSHWSSPDTFRLHFSHAAVCAASHDHVCSIVQFCFDWLR